jgi:DNA-binding transcriptional LysR family regulator
MNGFCVIGVKQMQDTLMSVEDMRPDSLRIGIDGSVMAGAVPTLLRQLHADFPALRWSLHESSAEQQFDALCAGGIDIGIWRGQPVNPERLRQNRLCQQLYAKEETALALPKGHRLARRNSIALPDLADETLLDLPACAASLPTLMAMVGSGIGLALVPSSAGSIGFPHVAIRKLRGAPSTSLYLAHSMDSRSSGLPPFLEVLNKERGVSPFRAPFPPPSKEL